MNRVILADNQAIFRAGAARVLALEDEMLAGIDEAGGVDHVVFEPVIAPPRRRGVVGGVAMEPGDDPSPILEEGVSPMPLAEGGAR